MSLLKFKLKNEHVLLLKHVEWSLVHNRTKYIVGHKELEEEEADIYVPFGCDTLYEGIDLILNGQPKEFDPLNQFDPTEYDAKQKDEWDKLYAELPIALDVILTLGTFELGDYVSTFGQRNWKKK
jgi:hypothetical protein